MEIGYGGTGVCRGNKSSLKDSEIPESLQSRTVAGEADI